MKDFDRLVEIMEDFKPFLEKDPFFFTYIAPKDKEEFYRFLGFIYNSSASHSLYLTLSKPEVVRKLLKDMRFSDNTELEIYVASNDQYAVQWINKPLDQYIHEQALDFQY